MLSERNGDTAAALTDRPTDRPSYVVQPERDERVVAAFVAELGTENGGEIKGKLLLLRRHWTTLSRGP